MRDAIHEEVCDKGYDAERNTFTQYYGSTQLDAALLLIPQVGFLPASDPRVVGTVEAVQSELVKDGFVMRYIPDEDAADGLPPGEGAFLACSFWLVIDLAMLGRRRGGDGAVRTSLSLRNDLGLFSEEYDQKNERLIGNFPQAFTHLTLIAAAVALSEASADPGHELMNAAPARPPSGTQHEIVRGSHRAVVTEVGAALRHYSVVGDDVLDGFGEDELAPAGRGQVLAPWPNRLDHGTYTFEGVEAKAALDEPERQNAIHGLVRWLPWTMVSHSADAVALGSLTPHPGYPWFLELELEYRLTDEGRGLGQSGERLRDTGALRDGFHPYLSIGVPVDDAMVRSRRRDAWSPTTAGCPSARNRSRAPRTTTGDGRWARRGWTRATRGCSATGMGRSRHGRFPRRRACPDPVGRRAVPLPDGVHRRHAGTGDASSKR